MNKLGKILIGVLFFFMFGVVSICYAQLTDMLSVEGSAEITADYDEVIITDVTLLDSSTVSSETHVNTIPTNVKSTFSGTSGQKIVYKINARNCSETETYIYTGFYYGDEYSSVGGRLSISVSADETGNTVFPDNDQLSYTHGTPVAPGEDFVFYVTYELTGTHSSSDLLVIFSFKPFVYSVTYMNDNEIYAVDYITDNSVQYNVRNDGPSNGDYVFAGWINANAVVINSYPAGNTNSYTLSAKWDNTYLIIFVDEDGHVIYEEIFTDSSKKNGLSAEGRQIVDQKLAELAEIAAREDMSVAWSSYDLPNATSDITVRPVYTYTGNLRFTPIDKDNDGIIESYQVDAVDELDSVTRIPGSFNGLPVEVINKLYSNNSNFDFAAGVTVIEVGEGVRVINHNGLAYTSDLQTVKLPSTLETINKNAFSRNTGDDKKVLTIEYNGTMAEWQALLNNSHSEWHNGLKTGSVVKCSDGYFELDRGFLGLGGYKWTAKSY